MKKNVVILIMLLWMVNAVEAYLLVDIPMTPPVPTMKIVVIEDDVVTFDGQWAHALLVTGASDVDIYDGQFMQLVVTDTSTVDIYGGDIMNAGTFDLGSITFHAYRFEFEDDYVYRFNQNGNSVRTKLYNGTYNYEVVPEPATLVMLGLGSLFFIRKKRNEV